MPIGREVKLLISSIVLIALTVVLAIQYTDVCRLQAVTLNGQPVDRWDQKLGLVPDRTVIRQPIDSLANALLQQQGITRVDIQYRLPNMLKISTNSLDPVCYMIDRATGTFFGLDESGRVVPIDISQAKWDMPIFTGLRVRRLHDYTDDYRVNLVIPQILQVRQSNPSLYQSIEEIDFSRPNYVGLGFTGRSFRLKVPADRLLRRFDEFNTFVNRYNPPLDSTSSFDMTYDDEIIRVGAVPHKELPPIDTASINDKADFSDEADLTPAGTMEVPAHAVSAELSAPVADGASHDETPTHPTKSTGNAKSATVQNNATIDASHKQFQSEKTVTPAATIQNKTQSAKNSKASATAKNPVVSRSKGTITPLAKSAKSSASQVAKPASSSSSAALKSAKVNSQSKIKGTQTRKSPVKKTKSKTSVHH